jgi:putative hydrolase of the HAD superfamily
MTEPDPPRVIAFDGDDTLWHSEVHFQAVQDRLRALAAPWLSGDELDRRLLATERTNLTHYGYGVKSFALSSLEVLLDATDGDLPGPAIAELLGMAKELLDHPVELLDGVVETLDALAGRVRLVLITKGDLYHQWCKIEASGLGPRFERTEVVHEKDPATYRRILTELDVDPQRFLMVGNSARSDILPVLELGAQAVQIPYEVTWAHEHHDGAPHWPVLERIGDVLAYASALPEATDRR